ncbi:MAG TPA: penicillin-binding protein activator [Acidiferrobacter sp.]|nr:penicillin-binding protein activator [Acidiferrobacter sp.]
MNRSPLLSATRALWVLALLNLFGLSLSGCAPSLYPQLAPATTSSAAQAIKLGHYVEGAQAYQHLAEGATGTARADLALKAVEALIHAGALPAASRELALVTGPLPAPLAAHRDILRAEVDAALGAPEQALKETQAARRLSGLSPQLLAESYRVEAQAALTLNRPLLAAQDLIAREGLLVSQRQLTNNERALWHALAGVSTHGLGTIYDQNPKGSAGAWAQLALIAKRYPAGSPSLKSAVQDWEQRYTQHQPTAAFLQSILGAQQPLQAQLHSIALLLPISSPFAAAAKAVELGFVDMATAHPLPGNPHIFIYDIGSNGADAAHYYQEAVAQGAQFIVGPLGADAVRNVADQAVFQVPTLLLGLSPDPIAQNAAHVPVYQFSLARTQEARRAADRAYLDGYLRAAILYPDTPWGHSMRRAFARRWRHLGGLVVSQGSYTAGSSTYVQPVEDLLNVTESRAREQRLEQLLRIPLAFTARRRQDIGFVFLVADAPDARLIKPQLDYDHADTLPVYSTSSVFTGRPDPVYDRDLDGILFGDMPWMLVGNARMARLRATLAHAHDYDFTPLARLYAFGADAESLVTRLDRLSLGGGGRYNGLTGALSVDRDDVIRRQLTWAQFRAGLPQLVDTSLPYKGLFAKKTSGH